MAAAAVVYYTGNRLPRGSPGIRAAGRDGGSGGR